MGLVWFGLVWFGLVASWGGDGHDRTGRHMNKVSNFTPEKWGWGVVEQVSDAFAGLHVGGWRDEGWWEG